MAPLTGPLPQVPCPLDHLPLPLLPSTPTAPTVLTRVCQAPNTAHENLTTFRSPQTETFVVIQRTRNWRAFFQFLSCVF